MKSVTYRDESGYLHRTLIRDEDDESQAKYGIPDGPPSVELIDWEGVKRELNNVFVLNGVRNWNDLQRTKTLPLAVNIIRRHIAALFRSYQDEQKQLGRVE